MTDARVYIEVSGPSVEELGHLVQDVQQLLTQRGIQHSLNRAVTPSVVGAQVHFLLVCSGPGARVRSLPETPAAAEGAQ